MTNRTPLSYPLTTDELHEAMARGREARSLAVLAWLRALLPQGGADRTSTPHGGAAPSLG